jgi:hypothetical protein
MSTRSLLAVAATVLALGVAGCGSSSPQPVNPNAKESSAPGDIPDNQAFFAYSPPGGGYSVKVPEGWARTVSGRAVTFTDKLNSIRMESVQPGFQLTVGRATQTEVPKLARSVHGFGSARVSTAARSAGTAVRITYLSDSQPDPVTGKIGRQAVERYLFFHKGRNVVLTLSGAKGADNVDPWRIVTDSLRWTR